MQQHFLNHFNLLHVIYEDLYADKRIGMRGTLFLSTFSNSKKLNHYI